MKSSRQRPLLRPRRSILNSSRHDHGPGASPAARLASVAGSERATVEPLEPRQMLFSLTISQNDVTDPASGVGQVRAVFGYYLPELFTDQVINDTPDVEVEELLDDEIPPAPFPNPQNVPSGTVFTGSNIQITHNVIPANNIQIFNQDTSDRAMRVRLNVGQFFAFQPLTATPPRSRIAVTEMSFDIGAVAPSNIGLNAANMTVQLFYRGQLIRSFTGAALLAQNPNGTGVGRFTFATDLPLNRAFDELRIVANSGPNDAFTLDDIRQDVPQGRFADIIHNGVYGTEIVLAGRVGTSIQVFDVYGNDMVRTIVLGRIPGSIVAQADLNDDGILDFNYGIGRIVINNGDESTALTMFGGLITPLPADPDTDFIEFPLQYKRVETLNGLYDRMEAGGFGFDIDPVNNFRVHGMPGGPGSVIIGLPGPMIRDRFSIDAFNAGGPPTEVDPVFGDVPIDVPITEGFARPDQGIFVTGGRSIAGIYIHGMLFGSSQFSGAVERIVVSNLMGSITVNGDLGLLVVAGEAGIWQRDQGTDPHQNRAIRVGGVRPNPGRLLLPEPAADITGGGIVKTRAQLVVGRTVGEIMIAGRSLLDVTVVGDVNSPIQRPPRDVLQYYEKEFVFAISPDAGEVEDTIRTNLFNTDFATTPALRALRGNDQGLIFGNQYSRNDTIMSAEWIGSLGTGVRVFGDLSARDPVNTGDDQSDAYAFASDGRTPITVEVDITSGFPVYFRILDGRGRTVAAPSFPRQFAETGFNFVQYTPDTPGVYYIVVTDPNGDDDGFGFVNYGLTILGMAPVTLGAYRTGANSGLSTSTASGVFLDNTISVLAGNVGSIRVGTGRVTGAGTEANTGNVTNSADESDPLADFNGGTFSLPGTLFNVTTGADVNGLVNIQVGGDFGTLLTGRSPVAGLGVNQGDLNFFTLSVGGRIAVIDVSGGSGIDGDDEPFSILLGSAGQTRILSGRSGGNGDIGMIRFGSHVARDSLVVQTSDNSTVGALLVSQDFANEDDNLVKGILDSQQGVNFNLGRGSDLRFADFPQIDLRASIDIDFAIIAGQFLDFVDDGGGLVRIRVLGAPAGAQVGRVLALPVNGSQGVAIGRIEVNLAGGAVLDITTTATAGGAGDVVSIGQIVVTGADGNAGIQIQGNVQTDVWRITTRAPLSFIRNSTDRGDIVAIDANALTDLQIGTGSLGRTQVPAWGPRLIGPFAGIGTGAAGGGTNTADTRPATLTLPGPGPLMDGDWNSQLYRPANNANLQDAGVLFLDDVGSPFDPYINGLVVRNGNLNTVRVGGAIGDVIVPQGRITLVSPNDDRVTLPGNFDGLVGTIYAADLTQVDVGDGLAQRDNAPLSTTGIFAVNDIIRITRENSPRASIFSTITAGNATVDLDQVNGIGTIELTGGGDFIDAHISASNLDNFWQNFERGDNNIATGIISLISGTDADLFRCEIFAIDLLTLSLTDGFYDATFTTMTRAIGTMSAAGYRNSTLTGGDLEFRANVIEAGGDIGTITTLGLTGDMNDLIVDSSGSVTGSLSARSMNRVQFEIDNTIALISVTVDLRASLVNAGQLTLLTAGRNVTASQITIAGPIIEITAGNAIVNSEIAATGAFGRIDTVTAANLLSGKISSSGPIGTIRCTDGDMIAEIVTTSPAGNVATLAAGRDLDIKTDIAGTVSVLEAGRHIGNRFKTGVIVVRGNLESATAGGQLYTDLRVGQAITGVVTIGQVSSRPGANELGSGSIYAFGAINAVNIRGDFDGDIISYSGGINAVAITRGSFLPGNLIAAYDGHINSVTITAGNLYGDIHADFVLYLVRVVADATGTFGDIGVNPAFNSNMPYDQFRNALPVGIAAGPTIQGPRITAGWNVGIVHVTNGSMFETSIIAGRLIGLVWVAGNPAQGNGNVTVDQFTPALANVFAAGDGIGVISVGGDFAFAYVMAGVLDLGSDGRPAGTGTAHDTMKSGSLDWLYIAGSAFATVITLGVDSGGDGIYSSADDAVVPGFSWVRNITVLGQVNGVFALSDSFLGVVDPRILQVGPTIALQDPQIDPGFGIPGVPIGAAGLPIVHNGATGALYFEGPGQAFWDAVGGRVVLRNTALTSYLTVSIDTPLGTPAGTPGTFTNFDIVTNDDASVGAIGIGTVVGSVFVPANLAGDSDIVIDAHLGHISMGNFTGTGSVRVGENMGSFFSRSFTGGSLSAKYVFVVVIDGDYGAPSPFTRDEVKIDIMHITGGLLIAGNDRGAINIDRDVPSMTVLGAMDGATLRAGATIGELNVGSMSRTWVSARDFFGVLNVDGDVFDSSIMAGADLGNDTEFGGIGLAADRVTTGVLAQVNVAGNFQESDIVAGIIRGPDGFFGTSDDSLSEGRSILGDVTIGGTQVGSDRLSESYRISSTGTQGAVTLGGQPAGSRGNFAAEPRALPPLPFQVADLKVTQEARIFTARLFFNQPADASSLPTALTVSEVRGTGEIEILLVNGVDYTLGYDPAENAAVIVFNRNVTNRDLPQQGGVPGPGVYRFRLDQTLARAQLVGTRLDGNADGRAPAGDHYSADDFVGDAGDKIVPNTTTVVDPNNGNTHRVDFYGPVDLNIVLDDNRTPDGLPDANTEFIIRGSIGDHPDNDTNYFRFGGDADLYKVTLQAGQILKIGRPTGAANLVPVNLIDEDGDPVSLFGEGAQATFLPVNPGDFTDFTIEQAYLIKTTGTYYILVSNTLTVADNTVVPNFDLEPGTIGDYAFTVQVFDDGNSGFSATTDAGNGTTIAAPPAPIAFAGPDQVFNTGDDLATITVGQFVYSHSRGGDNIPNTADDVVFGNDSSGLIISARDGTGLTGAVIDSAIGAPGHFGVPGEVFSDVDIYHLNSRLPIATGTRIRVTVRLTDIGADLGSRSQRNLLDPVSAAAVFQDYRGSVQLGIFDTTTSVGTDDGLLVLSPTDFKPNGGAANESLTAGENATYGYDDNGDFFVEFLAPGRQGAPGLPATYAVYVQGVFNTDYRLEIVQHPLNPAVLPTTKVQNIFLETRGGTIDWLQAGGLTTALTGFDAAQLGFTGSVLNGQPVQQYIIDTVRNTLQALYNAAGYAVNISTNPQDFEFQQFSTVYISAIVDPVTPVGTSLNFLGTTGQSSQTSTQPYGYAQHSDPLNADSTDEAVVFTPGMAVLGYTPTQADIDLFTQSLTAAIGRRVNELMGLRITSDYPTDPDISDFDIQAANSVSSPPGAGNAYSISALNRLLSSSFDEVERTDFFLGRQNANSLLDQILTPR